MLESIEEKKVRLLDEAVEYLKLQELKESYGYQGFFENTNVLKNNPDLNNDKFFVLKLLDLNPLEFQYASTELQNDREVAMKAILKEKGNLRYIGVSLKEDKNFMSLFKKY
ncbi:DUF4116 domain-containing protein [Fusobacterium necrophorum]|uniref:DUF4116 domain-containing protein n=1 Tax=Fusobacterium necrophorum TaxID=859 RepID=UPI0004803402|nr:DUF4116 domain-containing protein [Fusobacterium necrophorum]KYM48190.1 hypothetical protein A2U04_05550 [Fusobacterium necrophorum subsp. funduliforme]